MLTRETYIVISVKSKEYASCISLQPTNYIFRFRTSRVYSWQKQVELLLILLRHYLSGSALVVVIPVTRRHTAPHASIGLSIAAIPSIRRPTKNPDTGVRFHSSSVVLRCLHEHGQSGGQAHPHLYLSVV